MRIYEISKARFLVLQVMIPIFCKSGFLCFRSIFFLSNSFFCFNSNQQNCSIRDFKYDVDNVINRSDIKKRSAPISFLFRNSTSRMNMKALQYFLILSAVVELCGGFNTPPCPTGRHVTTTTTTTRGIAKNDNVNAMGLGLFRQHPNHHESTENEQKSNTSSDFAKRISQKLKVIRSVLTSRFFGGKKRCLSILAAALISAGAYPSQVIASTNMNPTALTKVVTASIRTSMDSEIRKSMDRGSFLQYNKRAPSNYLEDVSPVTSVFDTTLQPTTSETSTLLDEMEETDLPETTTVEDVAQVLAGETTDLQANDDLMILNDKMIKTGLRNIAVVGTAGTSLLVLNKSVIKRTAGVDDEETSDDVGEVIQLESEKPNAEDVATFEADNSSVLPLTDTVYVQARQQPKSPKQEAILAEKYAAIETVEERAFQVLVDLGMVEVR